jgi:cell wall-associated NlpC family hydrolase
MLIAMASLAATVTIASPASAADRARAGAATGGSEYGTVVAGSDDEEEGDVAATPTVPGTVAKIVDGVAFAPESAPDAVKQAIWAANAIVGMPYVYGGGHGAFEDDGYDCSGTVSFALHGADLLARPRDSSSFLKYGAAGKGSWITIYTNAGHAYMTIAGIRLDTSAAGDRGGLKGPRWRPLRRSNRGFKIRHPVGL